VVNLKRKGGKEMKYVTVLASIALAFVLILAVVVVRGLAKQAENEKTLVEVKKVQEEEVLPKTKHITVNKGGIVSFTSDNKPIALKALVNQSNPDSDNNFIGEQAPPATKPKPQTTIAPPEIPSPPWRGEEWGKKTFTAKSWAELDQAKNLILGQCEAMARNHYGSPDIKLKWEILSANQSLPNGFPMAVVITTNGYKHFIMEPDPWAQTGKAGSPGIDVVKTK
jgi:hypothetical protein